MESPALSVPTTINKPALAAPWLAWLMAVFIALYFWLDEPRLHRNLFYGAAVLGVWSIPRSLWRAVVTHRLFLIMVVYVAYQCVSTLWRDPFVGEEVGEALRKSALTVLFTILCVGAVRSHERRSAWLLIVAVTASALAAIGEFYTSGGIDGRLTGIGRSENAVQAGLLYGMGLIGVSWAAIAVKPATPAIALSLGIAWSILFAVLLLSGSRGGLGAAIIAHAILLTAIPRPRWLLPAIGLSILMIVLAAGATVDLSAMIARADSFRLDIWHKALDPWREHPWFGLGFRTPFVFALPYGGEVTQPHSIYVTALYFGGVAGLAVLLASFGAVIHALVQKMAYEPLARLGAALLCFSMVFGLADFSVLIVNSEQEWLAYWLPVAFAIATSLPGRDVNAYRP